MSDYPKGAVVPCARQDCGFLVMNAEGGWAHVDTHGNAIDHEAKPKLVTASTPPLVDVIAEALYRNDVQFPGELHPPFSELPTRAQNGYVHEARAVLAALTKAGGVEWAVVLDGLTYMFDSHEFDIAKRFLGHHGGQLSERTKAGPWTAVEG